MDLLDNKAVQKKISQRGLSEIKKKIFDHPDRYIFNNEKGDLTIDGLHKLAYIRTQIAHLSPFAQRSIIQKVENFKEKVEEFKKQKAKLLKGAQNPIAYNILKNIENRVLDLFGRYYNSIEIYKMLVEQEGYDLQLSDLELFKERYEETIDELRRLYQVRMSDEVRLTQKRSRIEELVDLFRSRKEFYQISQSRADSQELRAILEAIRKEVEGDKINLSATVEMNIEQNINIQIRDQHLKELNIAQLVLARIAAKKGVPVLNLLSELANSYYSEYTGFGGRKAKEEEEIIYPSALTYDFEEIAKINKGRNLNKVVEVEVVKDQDNSSNSIKDNFLKNLNKK